MHDTGDDYWAGGIDLLILRVADRLRRAGIDVAEAQLRRLAEEVVLDAARFVLDWVEAPGAAVSVQESGVLRAPLRAVAPTAAGGNEDASR